MAKKKTSTAQRWTLLKNFPTPETCHQAGPLSPRITPERDDHDQRRDRGDAEDVDPRGDVGGLAVGEELLRRQRADRALAHPLGPHRASRSARRSLLDLPASGRAEGSPAMKTTIISTITTTFATDIWKKCQWT